MIYQEFKESWIYPLWRESNLTEKETLIASAFLRAERGD
jgi:hypothetical protein